MGRELNVRVTFPGAYNWERRFFLLLSAANRHELVDETIGIIEDIARGGAPRLSKSSTMPAWEWITLTNLHAYVRAGALYVRPCSTCNRWFLAHHSPDSKAARRKLCASCQRASNVARQKKWRAEEAKRQRVALAEARSGWRNG